MVSVRAAKVKKLLTLFLSPLEFFSGIRGEWPAEWKLGAPPEVGPDSLFAFARQLCRPRRWHPGDSRPQVPNDAGKRGAQERRPGCRLPPARAEEVGGGPHGRADDTDFRVRQRGRRRPWQGPVARTPSGPERERHPAIETRAEGRVQETALGRGYVLCSLQVLPSLYHGGSLRRTFGGCLFACLLAVGERP